MSGLSRMPWRGVLVLTATWVFFTTVVFAQFCFLALVPVLAPVFAMQVVGAACLLTEAYSYTQGLARRPSRHSQPAAQASATKPKAAICHEPSTASQIA